jgi:hypothetical protein
MLIVLLALAQASFAAAPGTGFVEKTGDRPGCDYKNFELAEPKAEACRKACSSDKQCCAFVFVKPGLQGPKARCWLKTATPVAFDSQCCTTGYKPGCHPAAGVPQATPACNPDIAAATPKTVPKPAPKKPVKGNKK